MKDKIPSVLKPVTYLISSLETERQPNHVGHTYHQ